MSELKADFMLVYFYYLKINHPIEKKEKRKFINRLVNLLISIVNEIFSF